MRITGGEFCGRNLAVPKTGDIRPTQDRVREALFNILQCEIAGSEFVDLFAGSGAVGIEAMSRGAARVQFVEANGRHIETLKRNLELLPKLRQRAAEIACADVYRWIERYVGSGFSIAFADPPYALGEERGYASVLNTLSSRGVVRTGGLFIAEMTAVQKAEETPGWDLLRDRTYGKTRLCIWRNCNCAAK